MSRVFVQNNLCKKKHSPLLNRNGGVDLGNSRQCWLLAALLMTTQTNVHQTKPRHFNVPMKPCTAKITWANCQHSPHKLNPLRYKNSRREYDKSTSPKSYLRNRSASHRQNSGVLGSSEHSSRTPKLDYGDLRCVQKRKKQHQRPARAGVRRKPTRPTRLAAKTLQGEGASHPAPPQ